MCNSKPLQIKQVNIMYKMSFIMAATIVYKLLSMTNKQQYTINETVLVIEITLIVTIILFNNFTKEPVYNTFVNNFNDILFSILYESTSSPFLVT